VDGGGRDLDRLLRALEPRLHVDRYSFSETSHSSLDADAFAMVREEEGLCVIRATADGERARISLAVHSSLDAVGLTAAVSQALAAGGISANIIAGLRHDHIFVPWNRREEALDLLRGLSAAAR
jgi:uncharacterized protein